MVATESPTAHEEWKRQYGVALRVWSEAKAAFGNGSPEAIAATETVEELERTLATRA